MLIEDRDKYNEQDRVAALTVTMLHRDMIGRAIGHDVQDQFLAFLRDAGPWALIQEMPSLAVHAELLRARYPDTQAPWIRNDYHDVHFLSVAFAYCDAVCPDHRWADLAARSEYIANRGAVIRSSGNPSPLCQRPAPSCGRSRRTRHTRDERVRLSRRLRQLRSGGLPGLRRRLRGGAGVRIGVESATIDDQCQRSRPAARCSTSC
jgi:hypothetical protein